MQSHGEEKSSVPCLRSTHGTKDLLWILLLLTTLIARSLVQGIRASLN